MKRAQRISNGNTAYRERSTAERLIDVVAYPIDRFQAYNGIPDGQAKMQARYDLGQPMPEVVLRAAGVNFQQPAEHNEDSLTPAQTNPSQ